MRYRKLVLVIASLATMFIGSRGVPPAAAEMRLAWVHADAIHKRLSLTVAAAPNGANGTLNFNGYANGQMTITVPVGWQVHIDFVNSGAGTLPHSLEVIHEVHPVPVEGIAPAIPRAETSSLVEGVSPNPPDNKDSMDFTAAPAGQYLLICGVPRHAISGMWNRFVVSGSAHLPTVTFK